MERRRYLSLLAAGALGATGGCVSAPRSADPRNGDGGDGRRGRPALSLPVPDAELHRALPRDAIPAVVDPAFASDWAGVSVTVSSAPLRETIEPRLSEGSQVIGVERAGRARAYPLSVLYWHEVVNDTVEPRSTAGRTSPDGAGEPILVTYCPLCGSGVVAERSVAGAPAVFGVSGLLWKANLVMYDRATGSRWSQLHATAIQGARTGHELRLVPATFTTWRSWRDAHPDTEVLLPPPYSNTVRGREATSNYELNPYLAYEASGRVGVGEAAVEDDRLHPKTPVVGVAAGGTAKAYPLDVVRRRRVVNDAVGGRPVVVAVGPDRSLVAYYRRVDGATLRFRPAGEAMSAGGSRWAVTTGRALDGPHEGTRLERANERSPMFWFAWASAHPDTRIYGR